MNFHNVLNNPRLGALDPASPESTQADLEFIRQAIQLEVAAATSGRPVPSIARGVLTSIWERPRTGFHNIARRGIRGMNFRNKFLLIPWTVEAFDRMKSTNSTARLVLEHVMLIDATWKKLKSFEADCVDPDTGLPDALSDELWLTLAEGWLFNNYRLAVLTVEQAEAIDSVPGLRSGGVEGNPFFRYYQAECAMEKDRKTGLARPDFSVARFVVPGRN